MDFDLILFPKDIVVLGTALVRGEKKKFGIKEGPDRARHLYVIGQTGTGKSSLLENMVIQDIMAGRGLAFFDPHGDSAERLLEFVPEERIEDVIYFDPADLQHPFAFNVMEKVSWDLRHLVASSLLSIFKKIWPDVWSARMEYILSNALLALLEIPDSTLLHVHRILSDPVFRDEIVEKIKDPTVRAFWTREFARYHQTFEVEATAAIQNKIGQFISSPLIRNIIGQKRSSIDVREIMDNDKILIVNLSVGKIGEGAAFLLGGLLVTKLAMAAFSRADLPPEKRKNFYLYVDEFQDFATTSFIDILSQARKYGLCLIMANQYIAQLEEDIRQAIFGNVGSIISFRVAPEDAEFLEKQFEPYFEASDFVNLPNFHMIVKLLVDGKVLPPFTAQKLPPFIPPSINFKEEIIQNTRKKYCSPRERVETELSEWLGFIEEVTPHTGSRKTYWGRCFICGKETKTVHDPLKEKEKVFCKRCQRKLMKGQIEELGIIKEQENTSLSNTSSVSLKEALEKGWIQKFSKRKKDD